MEFTVVKASALSKEEISTWSDLQADNEDLRNPCFHPAYTLTASSVCDNVEVAVLRQRGRAVGFFPFQRKSRRVGGPVGGILSDIHGVITRPNIEFEAEELLKACGLDCWHFNHLLTSQMAFQKYHHDNEVSYIMDLSKGIENYLDGLQRAGSSVLSQVRRKTRQLEQIAGPLRFRFDHNDQGIFQTLVTWKREQLVKQGFADMFATPWIARLIEAIRHASSNDGFRGHLPTLHAGDELIAGMVGMSCGTTTTSWIPMYNPRYAKQSPGLIFHVELAKRSASEGITTIDLGCGENQMKTRLSSKTVSVSMGAVDLRFATSTLTSAWYGARKIVRSQISNPKTLQLLRRLRRA
ncbi:MAG: GNAT family N-acetyltransferase [Filomicrobium sp.]